MKILFVCHRFPYPPNEGGKIRAFNMIAHMQQNHQVTVASLVESKIDQKEVEGIQPYCHEYVAQRMNKPLAWLKALFCLLTFQNKVLPNFHSRKLGNQLRREKRQHLHM